MNYRALGKTGLQASEIGLGCEHLQGMAEEQVCAVIQEAYRQKINILDIFMSEPAVRTNLGKALEGKRHAFLLQGHIGAAWQDGQYHRTRDLDECKRFFQDFMTRLRTDYVDIGMLHFVDTQADYEALLKSGMVEYAQELKRQGVIKAVGMSSHDPVVARQAAEAGLIDVLMFSINPAFDLLPENVIVDDLLEKKSYENRPFAGVNPVRERLYRTCEARGVGITVMKTLGAGSLLSAGSSPFGKALTSAQCISYALTRPAVSSVLIGCKTPEEVRAAAAYEDTTEDQRDYAATLAGAEQFAAAAGRCMYCNHCLPCPAHIDIAQVNKYLDLAKLEERVPDTVREHYGALSAHASDCIACRNCERRCPFSVPVVDRMAEAGQLFGN